MTDSPTIDLTQLTRDIAEHLGEDWVILAPSPDVDGRELLRDDGALLRLRFTSPYSRASVTALGVFPGAFHDQPAGRPTVRIRASTARGPRAIAGDITRRLLPAYLPALERVRWFQREQAAAAARSRVANQIRQLLPEATCTPAPPGSHERALTVQWRRSGQPQEATVVLRDTAKTADLRLTGVPADTAVQICRLLSPLPRARVQVEDDFPPSWSVILTRSQDTTPLIDIETYGGDDHDEDGVPFTRIFINTGEAHEHMSAAARQWRDDPDPDPDPDVGLGLGLDAESELDDQEGAAR
ncbi:hypothetical protein [Actinomadura violacea]|uniref:Uncharacterized protein n=1 Tax=Actinomadura violacea TaxID=2819934 RepID=A0ABS3S7L9_9ACTN|nr:hypothetical protein [Actinomadura violacea]MBO2464998.1 hypothetical protein [Actinomadura violacea]